MVSAAAETASLIVAKADEEELDSVAEEADTLVGKAQAVAKLADQVATLEKLAASGGQTAVAMMAAPADNTAVIADVAAKVH